MDKRHKLRKIEPLGTPRCMWVDNIKMDLREVGWSGGGMDWIDLDQDREQWMALVNMEMNLIWFILVRHTS
jgi:hypothetical protein